MSPNEIASNGPAGYAERSTLYFRRGTNDKVYLASVESRGPGFVVRFAYGRRGGTLRTGTKTPEPVGYDEARALYDRLVREKLSKGYSPAPGDPSTSHPADDRLQATGMLPQLLNAIDEAELPAYMADEHWWAQEKFDGRRLMIRKDGPRITGINRRGVTVPVPDVIRAAVAELAADRCLLDGECVGDRLYHCFDLLERDGRDLRPSPYAVRFAGLVDLIDAVASDAVRYADAATNAAAKRATVERLRREGREGVVLKDRDAAHAPGRPASGGSWLKCKFYATATFLVARSSRRDGRRSVGLELLDGRGRRVAVGNVTVPPSHPVPGTGHAVEARYLYAFRGGGLCQPVYLGPRPDVAPSECHVRQLKYKTGNEDDEVDGDECRPADCDAA